LQYRQSHPRRGCARYVRRPIILVAPLTIPNALLFGARAAHRSAMPSG